MSDIYEDPGVLAEYLLFHYGSPEEILSPEVSWPAGMADALDFAVRTATRFNESRAGRGLDLGCAVGRSTFEMSRICDHVIGIDFSHAFIRAANTLREGVAVSYGRLDEAHRKTDMQALLPAGIDPSKASFLQGNAMHLPEDLGCFDRIHAANLICRLTDPELFLSQLPKLLNPGGELVLATPCTWLEEFTPPDKWPNDDTLEWLKDHLASHLELTACCDEPFLIRETSRKFQWTRSMLTVWRKR